MMTRWTRLFSSIMGRPVDPSEFLIWGTKGISFWGALSAILVKAQPESILEIGGGRSTTFLADYAFRFNKECMTIEESKVWQRKIANDLKCMNIRDFQVHHVPLTSEASDIWYDFDVITRLIGNRTFDLVFVDGPSHMPWRDNVRGQRIVKAAAAKTRLLIVDDVHDRQILSFFHELVQQIPNGARFYYAYRERNVLGIACAPEWRELVKDSLEFMNMNFNHEMPEAAIVVPKYKQAIKKPWKVRLRQAFGLKGQP